MTVFMIKLVTISLILSVVTMITSILKLILNNIELSTKLMILGYLYAVIIMWIPFVNFIFSYWYFKQTIKLYNNEKI